MYETANILDSGWGDEFLLFFQNPSLVWGFSGGGRVVANCGRYEAEYVVHPTDLWYDGKDDPHKNR
jgi:hypothetical protein